MELNYAGIINAGQGLVGDLQEQMMMRDQRAMQQQARQMQVQQAQAQQQRAQAFQGRLAQVVESQRYNDIPSLMLQFPEFADQIKPAYDSLSKDAKARNLTQLGTITKRASGGDVAGAVELLKRRVEADKEAGQDTSEEEEAIAMLSSPDPLQRQSAITTLHMLTFGADPEGYKTLFPADSKSAFSKEYEDRVRLFGKKPADAWVKVQDAKVLSVNPGGSIKTFKADTTGSSSNTEGGDQSAEGGSIPSILEAASSSGMITAADAERVRASLGPQGQAEYEKWVRENGITVQGASTQGPVRVRSIQEAMKLKPGTRYVTPEGEEYVR